MFNEYKKILKGLLKENRYIHSLGVMETAGELAERFGENADKARLAGLVHDCAKNITDFEEVCKKYNYTPDEIEEKNPELLHAPLGALMLCELFGIEDKEIEDAVRYHTVARRNMTNLDKIIYLSDMIEPSRNFYGVEDLRAMAKEDLDKAVLHALDQSLMFVIKKGALAHPNTLYARNELKGKEIL